jgi:hypothetical protein
MLGAVILISDKLYDIAIIGAEALLDALLLITS